MERVVVGRGGTCELEFHILCPRTVLQWEFVSVDYDVSFGWYIREGQKRKMMSSRSLREIVSRVTSSYAHKGCDNKCKIIHPMHLV